jgi:hypothetical protein
MSHRGWPSGARLNPSGSPDPRPDRVDDPAHGAKVPRCWACGMPDQPDAHLWDFELRLAGKYAGCWRLCERCYVLRNPPPLAVDPLEVAV